MKAGKMPPAHQAKSGSVRAQSPSLNNTKGNNASKDLESYMLRNSTESLKGIKQNYNFKEVDSYEEKRQSSSSKSPPQRDRSKNSFKDNKVTKAALKKKEKQESSKINQSSIKDLRDRSLS